MSKKKCRRMPKVLNTVLYVYVQKENAEFARTQGERNFGSSSKYVDALIAANRKAVKSRMKRATKAAETKTVRAEA